VIQTVSMYILRGALKRMSRFRLSIWSSRLLWKLAVSYFIVTLSVIVAYILIDIEIAYRDFQSRLNATSVVRRLEREVPRFASLMRQDEVGAVAVEHLLFRVKYELEDRRTGLGVTDYFALGDFRPEALGICIVGAKGSEIARAGPFEEVFRRRLSLIVETGGGVGDAGAIIAQDDATRCVAALIRDHAGGVAGAVMLRLTLPRHWWEGISLGAIIGDLRLIDLVFMALMSLTFGFIVARQLTKRLERIFAAANGWARGDFSVVVNDSSADELGELARRLNRMAYELGDIVTLRQNLAASEERNRLARDLHDTVKQRAFALSMQIGAAQASLESNTVAAVRKRLTEAERLSQIQRELVTLLEELRSDAKQNQNIVSELWNLITEWSQQSGVQVKMECRKVPSLSGAVKTELFRITQESLSNVARHAAAKNVLVRLGCDGDKQTVSLTIRDDGRGFDMKSVAVGMGLQNMRERAESLPGGVFTVESQPQAGVCIEARCKTD
jgi:signal transduction histidine kinase